MPRAPRRWLKTCHVSIQNSPLFLQEFRFFSCSKNTISGLNLTDIFFPYAVQEKKNAPVGGHQLAKTASPF